MTDGSPSDAPIEPADSPRADHPEADAEDWGGAGLAGWRCVLPALACALLVAAIVIPNLIEARKGGNETAAIGALKTLVAAQSLFRESDKEADGELDYAGNTGELANAGRSGLIDRVLGSGIKQGYVFRVTHSVTTPEFLWMAVASPTIPGSTGNRTFITNHEGVTFYTSSHHPVPLDPIDCSIPLNLQPVGR